MGTVLVGRPGRLAKLGPDTLLVRLPFGWWRWREEFEDSIEDCIAWRTRDSFDSFWRWCHGRFVLGLRPAGFAARNSRLSVRLDAHQKRLRSWSNG
jgi:hypothetical protein